MREKFYKDELRYHLKMNRKLNRSKSQNCQRPKSKTEFISSTIKSYEKRPERPKVPAGLLTIRSTHTPALTKREKLSMVNITSKIMSASSELCFQKEDILLMKSLADAKSQNVCYVRQSRTQSRREEQDRNTKSISTKSAQESFTSENGSSSDAEKQKPIAKAITPVREPSPTKPVKSEPVPVTMPAPAPEKTAEEKRDEMTNKVSHSFNKSLVFIYWVNLFRLKFFSSFLQVFYEILSQTPKLYTF